MDGSLRVADALAETDPTPPKSRGLDAAMAQQTPRPYRQVARAAATERTQQRIVEVFFDMLLAKRLDEITLDAVAAGAETTRQTVIRLIGGKDKLIQAASELAYTRITSSRVLPPNAPFAQVADVLMGDYEATGDMVLRFLCQEDQYPELTPMLATGRKGHRTWVAETFATHLDGLPEEARENRLDELVAVTDVYIWKLFRRDFDRSREAVTRLIETLIGKVVAGSGT